MFRAAQETQTENDRVGDEGKESENIIPDISSVNVSNLYINNLFIFISDIPVVYLSSNLAA